MSFTRNLHQKVTYWAPTGTDSYGGTTFAAPQILIARWEDNSEMFRDKTGQETTSRARVFFNQDIALDGYLYLGESNEPDPREVAGAYEIRQVKTTPNLRNLQSLRVAML